MQDRNLSRRTFVGGGLASPPILAALERPADTASSTEFGLPVTRDLRLPDWGPYTKKYFGISHIPVPSAGYRFDLGVFPGFFRRTPLVPNVLWESGYHPWEASSDLSYYSTRFEVEWKDRVYVDLSFCTLAADSRLIACEVVNRTDSPQNLSLHFMASMQFPAGRHQVILPPGAVWVDALDYRDLVYAVPRPTDHLVTDGLLRGEFRDPAFVDGSGVGRNFGASLGDRLAYRIHLERPLVNAVMVIRYRNRSGAAARFQMAGLSSATLELPSNPAVSTVTRPLGDLAAGDHALVLTATGGIPVELDGIALVESQNAGNLRFEPVQYASQPEIAPGPFAASRILKYKGIDPYYGLAWNFDSFQVREFLGDDLDNLLRFRTHDHVSRVIRGAGEGHYTDVFLRPVTVPPQASQTIWGVTCSGTPERVAEILAEFPKRTDLAEIRQSARRKRASAAAVGEGAKYSFSQERMAATTLAGVIYPIYIRRTHIRHNTPGRWWDSLYTWDAGFIGLGLLEHDVQRAVDCLNTYTTAPGDPHAAFIHHGSPVPVQIYLLLEIWNRTRSRRLLEYFYPRLRQMHLFLAGRVGGSTTRRLASQLLTTWDYFYNTGGWDDYPPQVYVHENRLESGVAPTVNTAHAIRCARMLRMMAAELGETADLAGYDADIRAWGEALQKYAWDEASGYFGYVTHTAQGEPNGILRHKNGTNFNMGMDGVSPLLAGICTDEQAGRLTGNLMSENRMWTRIGITSVDQSAAYYRHDGYWNGAVWMPHQWFLWKTMLDLGRGAEASRIARTALDLWKKEVEQSYSCFEHFLVQSGRGAGWHQFTSLSCPVMSWFSAYYRPGRFTVGFDTWVTSAEFSRDHRSLHATVKVHGDKPAIALTTMAPSHRYRVLRNRTLIPATEITAGTLQIPLMPGKQSLEIELR
jgi:hypothetical protein